MFAFRAGDGEIYKWQPSLSGDAPEIMSLLVDIKCDASGSVHQQSARCRLCLAVFIWDAVMFEDEADSRTSHVYCHSAISTVDLFQRF